MIIHPCNGQVSVGFPFNEQLPNVARVDEPYSFTMANSTYKSSLGSQIYYQVSQLPDWLQFDSNSRTFTGTPSNDHVGDFQIDITGTDNDNSLTQSYTMIVSNDTGVELTSPGIMFTQISNYGRTNGKDGLVVKEGQEINIKFDKSIFESKLDSNRSIVAYYGRSADRSSLPNWINFNPDDLSFSGKVPHVTSESAPSFKYGFSFIASDYYGFAGAEGLFNIVVGGHQLSTNVNHTMKINGSLNNDFDVQVPVFSKVFLDGENISKENISAVYGQDLPDYVDFDQQNYTLTGNFPDKDSNDTFAIVIKDIYGNQVQLPYSFDAIASLFTLDDLPSVNATKGDYFQYQLMNSFFTDVNDTEITADFKADWLTYDSDNKTFYGNTPDDFDDLKVEIDAASDSDQESKSFMIKGIDLDDMSSSSSQSSSASSSSSSSSSSESSESAAAGAAAAANTNKDDDDSDDDFHKKLTIGLAVGIPCFLLLIAGLIVFCCCVRRKKKNNQDEEEEGSGDTTLEEGEVTGPGFGYVQKSPQNGAATNAEKLDQKDIDDIQSTSSSMTHVEGVTAASAAGAAAVGAAAIADDGHDSDDSRYYDANETNEKPMKSWRANDQSDMAKNVSGGLTKTGNIRKSDASLSTVNTEQLFSVRLVEEQSILRNSQQSSFGSGQFISNNSLNALLNREDSGNIQRLDSDGNIVDSQTNSPRKPVSRSPSGNLGVLVENSTENTRDYSSDYHSVKDNHTVSTRPSKHSLYDDFKATQTEDGNYDWLDTNNPGSSGADGSGSPGEYQYLNNGKPLNLTLSDNSLESHLSSPERPENQARISSSSLGKKAKLVDFTRRSSLRESAHNLHYTYEGESVQIHEDQDSI